MKDYFEWTRQKEERAIENKKRTKRKGPARPIEIAVQIFNEIKENEPELLKKYPSDFLNSEKPFDVLDLPEQGEPEEYSDMFTKHAVSFVKGKKGLSILETKHDYQALLVCLVGRTGIRGLVRVPQEETECKRVLDSYKNFIMNRDKRFLELVDERTADEDMQEKILESLMILLRK